MGEIHMKDDVCYYCKKAIDHSKDVICVIGEYAVHIGCMVQWMREDPLEFQEDVQ